jgi:hypothetical protein
MCGAVTWLPALPAAGARALPASDGAVASDTALVVRPSTSMMARGAAQATKEQGTALSTTDGGGGAGVDKAPTSAQPPGGARLEWSVELRARVRQRLSALPPDGADDVAQAFDRLLDHWPVAGQRYRAVLDVVPGDAMAKKAQADLLALAMVTMRQDRELGGAGNTGDVKKAASVVIAVLAFALIGYLVWTTMSILRGGDEGAKIEELGP